MSSQRPFFLSTFFAAFRQQGTPSSLSSAQQPNKHTTSTAGGGPSSYTSSRAVSSNSNGNNNSQNANSSSQPSRSGVIGQLPLHSPRGSGIPIPQQGRHGRRRGSDSSSEGFRDVLGAEKLYIGGRTATGEEKFFKLGVVRRVRSGDRLSFDRLSL
ncbi:hypothetical protein B0H66DRAFT_397356 [Apodospora peruviana]|uniref:Uncharacterized protein n=1 Tax=Apodospora peruviana TaxID=516989 RepID=A0AAE0LYA9_9PEZI|nr:hypothetical protein B0H66DRAFT_397356 [Apodospora peruviana]